MKLTPVYTYLKDGSKIINSYRLPLTKIPTEKAGFKAGDEVEIKYENKKIIVVAKE